MVVPSPSKYSDEDCTPRDDKKIDDEGECVEDKNISAFEVSEENPFLNGWTNGVKMQVIIRGMTNSQKQM